VVLIARQSKYRVVLSAESNYNQTVFISCSLHCGDFNPACS